MDRNHTEAETRAARIKQVLDEVLNRRHSGEDPDEEQLAVEYPELMPDLGDELRKLSVIERARRLAGASSATVSVDQARSASRYDQEVAPTEIPDYELLRSIGRGGFGEVWLCRNRHEGQFYAVKLITRFSAIELDGIREYKARAENNPYLMPIGHVGQVGECYYYLMPLADDARGPATLRLPEQYEPMTLERHLKRHGLLQLDEVLSVSLDLLSALSRLHDAGGVHCDVKPANVLMLQGSWVLGDPGLMCGSESPPLECGTPGFWPPEGVRDHTADLYALGKTLYLLTTGAALDRFHEFAAGALDIPSDPRAERLRRIIVRACHDDRSQRFSAARPMYEDITEIGALRVRRPLTDSVTSPSIAVLPFVNMSSDKGAEYFSDGLAEELTNALTRVENLRVAARTAAFQFKGKTQDIRRLGKQLNVDTVLEGSVRKAGRKLRVSVQLISVADGYNLWSEKYDREAEDIFVIQEEIAQTIVQKLRHNILVEAKAPLVRRSTDNLGAYNLYLKGRYYRARLTEEGLRKAIECFEQAIEKDPDYAQAYAGLADGYSALPYFSNFPPRNAYPVAQAKARRALEIDATLAEAHTALATVRMNYDWEWTAAEAEFRRAIELDPNNAFTYYWYGHHLAAERRYPEAIAAAIRAEQLEPLSLVINTFVGFAFYFARQYDRAIERCQRTIEMDSNFFEPYWALGKAYEQKMMHGEALNALHRAVDLSRRAPITVAELAVAEARSGNDAETQRILDELHERSRAEYIAPICFVLIHAARGAMEEAFEWLEDACEERSHYLIYLDADPVFRSLRSDPRFHSLLGRIGLARRSGNEM